MLHRVVKPSNQPRIHNTINEISPNKLEQLIRFYISQDIQIISLDEIGLFLSGRRKGRFVVFTFDDGYKDNLYEALPVFKKFQVPFTVYVATGFPDHHMIIWWYLLEKVLLEHDSILFNWGEDKLEFSASAAAQKEIVFNEIRRLIIDTPHKIQKQYLKNAFQHYINDPFELTREMALNWDEVRRLSDSSLVTLGAHTLSHPALNQLNESEVIQEVSGSRRKLAEETGKEIRHFSYPFGSAREVGKKEFELVSGLGFSTSATTRPGNILEGHINHLECLPRIHVGPDTTLEYLKEYISGERPFMAGAGRILVTE